MTQSVLLFFIFASFVLLSFFPLFPSFLPSFLLSLFFFLLFILLIVFFSSSCFWVTFLAIPAEVQSRGLYREVPSSTNKQGVKFTGKRSRDLPEICLDSHLPVFLPRGRHDLCCAVLRQDTLPSTRHCWLLSSCGKDGEVIQPRLWWTLQVRARGVLASAKGLGVALVWPNERVLIPPRRRIPLWSEDQDDQSQEKPELGASASRGPVVCRLPPGPSVLPQTGALPQNLSTSPRGHFPRVCGATTAAVQTNWRNLTLHQRLPSYAPRTPMQ